MPLYIFCPRWGSKDIPWVTFVKKVKLAGYDGIELGFAPEITDKEIGEIFELAERYNLQIILQHYETVASDFNEHYDAYASWFQRISQYRVNKINSHTGRDFFSFEQNAGLIQIADTYAAKTGIMVAHETHRSRGLYALHVANEYFKKLPTLGITLDASHWVTVAETFLDDQIDALLRAFERTIHLHARVGHTQSPQVPDPRLLHWDFARQKFFEWWGLLFIQKKALGDFTVTPEFGPFPYMPLNSFAEPVANQWELNTYMMDELRQLWDGIKLREI